MSLRSSRRCSPALLPRTTSSVSLHLAAQRRESPSSRLAMMRPLLVMLSNASSGVFFIHPFSVVSTTYSSDLNSLMGSTLVILEPASTGRTDGRLAPLAVRPANGTWYALRACATPPSVTNSRVSWSLQEKHVSTELSASAPALPLVPLSCDLKSDSGIRFRYPAFVSTTTLLSFLMRLRASRLVA